MLSAATATYSLDIRTIWVAICAICAIYSLIQLGQWLRRRPDTSMLVFGLMSFVGAVGGALLSLRGMIPTPLTHVVANFLVLVYWAVLWVGMRIFAGRPVSWPQATIPPVLVALVFQFLPFLKESSTARSVGVSLVGGAYILLIVYDVLVDERREPLLQRRLIALVAATCLITLPTRPVRCAAHVELCDLYAPDGVSAALSLSFLGVVSALGALLIMMVNERLANETRATAARDPHTGLYNRRGMNEIGAALLRSAADSGRRLSILVMDIDRFKTINDRYGHAVGDDVLRVFANVARAHVDGAGEVFRHGGEEFCALLPGFSVHGAEAVAENIRAHFESTPIDTDAGRLSASVSIGVADLRGVTETLPELLQRGDAALYSAKRGGRNRVSVCESGRGAVSRQDRGDRPASS